MFLLVIILPITPFINLDFLFNSSVKFSFEIELSITLKYTLAFRKSLEISTLDMVIIPEPSD